MKDSGVTGAKQIVQVRFTDFVCVCAYYVIKQIL